MIRLLLLAMLVVLAPLCARAMDWSVIEEPWRPSTEVIVASYNADPIDQETIYLWQLLNGDDPLVARLASDLTVADPRHYRPLEEAVRAYVFARMVAEDAMASPDFNLLQNRRAARVLAGPAAVLVFGDLLVRPDVVVTPNDIAYFYQQNQSRFVVPESAEILRVLMPAPGIENLDERRLALEEAEAVRARAIAEGGGLRPYLLENPAHAMDQPPGRSFMMVRGQSGMRPSIEDEILRRSVAQITEPIVVADGVLLAEIVQRFPERRQSLESVRAEIEALLTRRFFRQQLEYQAERAWERSGPITRGEHYALLEDEMEVLIVNDFVLSKGLFRALFPEVHSDAEHPPLALREKVRDLAMNEVLTQRLATARLLGHPRYEKASRLARVLAASQLVNVPAEDVAEPTDEEVDAFIEENRELLAPSTARALWRLSARPRSDEMLSDAEAGAIAARMRQRMDDVLRESERLLADRARINGPVAYVTPQFVVDRLISASDPAFAFVFESAGDYTTARAREELGIDLESTEAGTFVGPVARGDGSLVAWYVADRIALEPTPPEELRERARQAMRERARSAPVEKRLDEAARMGQLVLLFPHGAGESPRSD